MERTEEEVIRVLAPRLASPGLRRIRKNSLCRKFWRHNLYRTFLV